MKASCAFALERLTLRINYSEDAWPQRQVIYNSLCDFKVVIWNEIKDKPQMPFSNIGSTGK